MINKSLLKNVIDEQSIEYAKNKKIIDKALIKMLLNYKKSFFNFVSINSEEIKKFFKNSKDEKWLANNIEIARILNFLYSGLDLINKGKLKEEEFNNYSIIIIPEELNKVYESLSNAENIFNWKGTKKLNNNLQFILAFHDNIELRIDYFKKFLWELNKEEKMENKDYRTNIFEKLIPDSPININNYNYL